MKEEIERVHFLRVLVNNLISASRKAEGAWGARALGQLLMQTYPELGVLRDDILGTETHPGSVLSVIWLYSQSKNAQSYLSILFWLVLPRLKQKKVAEYLPKLLDDIISSLGKGQSAAVTPAQISGLIFNVSDAKLSKPTQKKLTEFFNSLREHLKPDSTWLPLLLGHLSGGRQHLSLPLVIHAVEASPAKATQVLKEQANENRLQVKFVLDSLPDSTLGSKHRKIVEAALEQPMASSEEIKREAKPTSGAGDACCAKKSACGTLAPSCAIFGLFKHVLRFLMLVGIASQFQVTRPYYETYAQPYYNAYMKDTVEGVIMPKYDEFVDPHVQNFVIPTYNTYVAPHVAEGMVLYNKHAAPKVKELKQTVLELYMVHLAPQINTAAKQAGPAVEQFKTEANKLFKTAMSKAADLKSTWGEKADATVTLIQKKTEEYGTAARKWLESSAASASEWAAKQNAKETAVAYLEIGRETALTYLTLGQGKAAELYEFVLVASADQREFLKAKSVVALAFLSEKFEVVRQLAVSYEVDTLFGKVFEGLGRTVIWIGELVGELAEMRWCCASNRLYRLKDLAVDVSKNVYEKFSK